jgi:adenylate cyclase
MAIEIERKFLVTGETWRDEADDGTPIRQAYLANGAGASVRVRCAANRAWITVKGEREGIARPEYEYEIPPADADAMLASLCTGPILQKTRYRVLRDDLIWEVDLFEGAAAGLIVAEVELTSIDQTIILPEWIGDEVTEDRRYRNAAIARDGPPLPDTIAEADQAAS